MQDNYVGDIGDFGKFGLLRAVAATGLSLAVNWYRTVPVRPGNQNGGVFTGYLQQPDAYRRYDPDLFDALARIVREDRTLEALESSGILRARFFGETLTGADRPLWHRHALEATAGADADFLDPDNGLETARMHARGAATDKHVAWQEAGAYFERGQSVILYQHRPQRQKKAACVRRVLEDARAVLPADAPRILEFPRYTTRFYFLFAQPAHRDALEAAYRAVAESWKGLCTPVAPE